nr:carboxypeptidase-like regulatory domain-containing protein [Bacteroides pyogenes]
MKKISSILLLMILLTATAEAGIIKGSIKDKQTKEPLTGATVQIAAINAGTVADLNGNYTLHVANGIYTITVTYIGYKPIELRDIKAEKETTLNFEMEADSRAFSFDLIPSSQLDNMIVVKSPAPEYPSDFTGGFILIQTKDVPSKSSFSINLNGGLNDRTHFNSFLYEKESGTDFLGFDNGLRSLKGGIDGMMNPVDGLSGSHTNPQVQQP